MHALKIFNPDHYLGSPRRWSPEAGKLAWEKTYEALELAFTHAPEPATLYVVCGIQGSGKSTWIQNNAAYFKTSALVLDAALPGARHRQRAILLAQRYGAIAHAIWINTPLEQALRQNRLRPMDDQVPDETIRAVAAIFEAPNVSEGFHEVIEIEFQ